ncbi:MAG: hypothetical protein WHT27_00755 [candidate division WOR-3 bacterium]
MKKFFYIILMSFFCVNLFSYVSLYNTGLGDFNTSLFSKGAALGNNDFFFNPLLNPTVECKTTNYLVSIGFYGLSTRETRSKYIFDSYENSIAKKNVYDNTFLYGEPAYIMGYMPLSDFGLYLGYENYINNDYTYRQIYRNDNYVILYDESYVRIGNVNAYFLSLNYRFYGFAMGTNFSIMQGDGSSDYSKLFVDPSFIDSTSSTKENYSGIRGNIGISYNHKDNFILTFVYNIRTYLTVNRVTDIIASDTNLLTETVYYIIPDIFSFGLEYRAKNVAPATFYYSLSYERWSELNGDFNDYNDLIKYNIGVLHELNKNIDLMYGFMYEPYRKDNRLVDIGFATGLTYKLGMTEFSVAVNYKNINYEREEVYYNDRVLKFVGDVSIKF